MTSTPGFSGRIWAWPPPLLAQVSVATHEVTASISDWMLSPLPLGKSHVINASHQARFRFFGCRDGEHFVLDDVSQLMLLQHESQRRPERNITHVNCDGFLRIEAGIVQRRHVQLDRYVVLVLELIDNLLEGCLIRILI